MELTNEKTRELALKLQKSRLRLLENHPFYGMLLLNLGFSLDVSVDTAYTNGNRIAFSPEFLDSLAPSEVDFVLMHEILHTALGHCWRGEDKDEDVFNIATDVVVNSNILQSCNMNLEDISLADYGEGMHNLPDGQEGYNFSAEEIYPILYEWHKRKDAKLEDLTSLENKIKLQNKDLSSKPKIGAKSSTGQKNKNSKDGGKTPKDGEGENSKSKKGSEDKSGTSNNKKDDRQKRWDNHDKWNKEREPYEAGFSPQTQKDLWLKRMVDATDLLQSMDPGDGYGSIPKGVLAIIKKLRESKLDWKTMLQNFIQEDITDYSFTPPDRRFDGDFFLPDFNEKEENVKNILFMIDTSGSMSDDMITDAFSEVKGALDQFNGRLAGKLGFFDAMVYKPIDFEAVEDLLKIKPKGRGGTDFDIIFDYVKTMDEAPASIIILTDGYANIPKEEKANGIPVLWVINNENVTPDWGMVARIKEE